MRLKPLIIVSVMALALLCFTIYWNVTSQDVILDYGSYQITEVNAEVEGFALRGVMTASGLGQKSFTYAQKGDALYLRVFQQEITASPPLKGEIALDIAGDYSSISAVYLVQDKGVNVQVWSRAEGILPKV